MHNFVFAMSMVVVLVAVLGGALNGFKFPAQSAT
jgi:hypothetical protein